MYTINRNPFPVALKGDFVEASISDHSVETIRGRVKEANLVDTGDGDIDLFWVYGVEGEEDFIGQSVNVIDSEITVLNPVRCASIFIEDLAFQVYEWEGDQSGDGTAGWYIALADPDEDGEPIDGLNPLGPFITRDDALLAIYSHADSKVDSWASADWNLAMAADPVNPDKITCRLDHRDSNCSFERTFAKRVHALKHTILALTY